MSRNDELTDVNARYCEIINHDIIYRLKLALAVFVIRRPYLHDGIIMCHGRNYFLLLCLSRFYLCLKAVVEKCAYL